MNACFSQRSGKLSPPFGGLIFIDLPHRESIDLARPIYFQWNPIAIPLGTHGDGRNRRPRCRVHDHVAYRRHRNDREWLDPVWALRETASHDLPRLDPRYAQIGRGAAERREG